MSIIASIKLHVISIFQTGMNANLPAGGILAMLAGKNHFSFCITNRAGDVLYRLNYFSVKEWDNSAIQQLLAELPTLDVGIQGVELAFESGAFTLVPVADFQDDKLSRIHHSLHPFSSNHIFKKDSLAEWQLYIGYTIPSLLLHTLQARYPDLRVRHCLKLALQQAGQSGRQGKLLVNFRPNYFFVVLLRNNRLQFAQEFIYDTPADVLYYLLKIGEDLLISPHEIIVELTGLVDQESALYRELCQYFINLEFRKAGWQSSESAFPAHYFTSLNDLAKCAS